MNLANRKLNVNNSHTESVPAGSDIYTQPGMQRGALNVTGKSRNSIDGGCKERSRWLTQSRRTKKVVVDRFCGKQINCGVFLRQFVVLVIMVLLQSLTLVIEAQDILGDGIGHWSNSFVQARRSSWRFGEKYGDEGWQIHRGESNGEGYWDSRNQPQKQRPLGHRQEYLDLPSEAGVRALSFSAEDRRVLQEGNSKWMPMGRSSRLNFNKQVHSGNDATRHDLILGTKGSSLNMISICLLHWATCKNGVVVSVDLSNRGFTGPIPSSIALLTGLESLILKNNKFGGEIPSWLGGLTNLTTLDLSCNQLSGRIPQTLVSLGKLRVLDLSHNQLQGSIPPDLANLSSLMVFKLLRNKFSGPIPNLCRMTGIRFISLAFNNLSGVIPQSVGCFSNLQILSLARNNLIGPLPVQLSDLRQLRVLNLENNHLTGPIPFEFVALKFLRVLRLQENALTGNVPYSLGMLGSLEQLKLSANLLDGAIPSSLGMLSSLRVLDLSNNLFSGSLPDELSLLSKLKTVFVDQTHISGSIPSSYGNLVSLQALSLSSNSLSGLIPSQLGNLRALLFLDLEANNLTGPIPKALSNCISLKYLLLSSNSLSGAIPPSFAHLRQLKVVALGHNNLTGALPVWGLTSPLLEEIILTQNSISGRIPTEWGQLSFLRVIALSFNKLTGSIPDTLVQCKLLQQLWLDHNALTGRAGDWLGQFSSLAGLSFANNKLDGPIPHSLSNCQLLQTIYLGSNFFSGVIPSELGRLPNLVVLSLSLNNLQGPIPPQLGDLLALEGLDLNQNSLSGELPSELMKLMSLRILLLGYNSLTGPFPIWVTHLNNLQALDLTGNSFVGELPLGFTNLTFFMSVTQHLSPSEPRISLEKSPGLGFLYRGASKGQTYLMLGGNMLTGSLPNDFGALKNLWVLDVHKNQLSGRIPASLGGAEALSYLDLSENSFSGPIPEELENLSFLSFLNVSNNLLSGKIPDRGQFDTFGPDSFLRNHGLCGVPIRLPCIQSLSIPPAQLTEPNSTAYRHHDGKLAAGALIGIALASALGTWALLALIVWWQLARRRTILTRVLAAHDLGTENWPTPKEALSINVAMFQKFLPKLTLRDLMKATDNFAIENVIGDGGFGTVYKASFQGDKVVAVKRLMGDKAKGQREFLAEMETLGKVKHGNIVPLIGYCTYGADRLLVYEYMFNGNLDLWLHTCARVSAGRKALNWSTRLKIAQGTARGVAFLHHVCVPHIIHRDIKASNILLDSEFTAYVSDFGLARLISAYDSHLSTNFAGTVGYIPPEYGQSPLASTKGDVYSFGIVLLEVLTGRRPTDRFLKDKDDSDLVGWVRHLVLQNKILEVFDPELVSELDSELRDRVDRLVGLGGDSEIHPHFFPGSSQGSSSVPSPLFSPDVNDLEYNRHNVMRVTNSCTEFPVPHRLVAPRLSLGLSSVSSPASVARRSSFGYSPVVGFEGIPEFECRFMNNGMKQELIRVLGLAVWCTEDTASKRPSMLQACKLLDTIVNNQRVTDQE